MSKTDYTELRRWPLSKLLQLPERTLLEFVKRYPAYQLGLLTLVLYYRH